VADLHHECYDPSAECNFNSYITEKEKCTQPSYPGIRFLKENLTETTFAFIGASVFDRCTGRIPESREKEREFERRAANLEMLVIVWQLAGLLRTMM
jgi:hypothetical protein